MDDTYTPWLDWAMELQSLAQAGLFYSNNVYDIERFERIREISAEIMSMKSALSTEVVKDLFCNETGYQTPKMDTRAAIFKEDKILLVKEKLTNNWSMPGGWVDVCESVQSNTIKEVKEEAGLDVIPIKLIAIQDRRKHNQPLYAYNVCKIFIQCEIIGGAFQPNTETTESGFFAVDDLPVLSEEKNTQEQIQMCFKAYYDHHWIVPFD